MSNLVKQNPYQVESVPIGSITQKTTVDYPEGYVRPIGQELSRTQYTELNTLYAKNNFPYGSGDGVTTFNLPNYSDDDVNLMIKIRSCYKLTIPENISIDSRLTALETAPAPISGTATNAGYVFTETQFEDANVGWVTYKDSAQATPENGIGGTAGIVYSRDAISPLVETASGLITKGASNLQGEGLSHTFTIDAGLSSTPSQIKFLYQTSANFAHGDMAFYIYDVTNGILITPNNILLPSTNTTNQVFIANFYPTVSSITVTYRFILHIASTSALDYTVKLDDITLGSKETIVAPAISDWQSYTPTFQGFGIPTAIDFKWRHNGSNCDIKGKFTVGALTGVEARVGLPNSYTSRADVSTIELVGMGEPNLGNASNYITLSVLSEASKDYVCFGIKATSIGGLTKQNANLLVAAGSIVSVTASIPCAQFSVNTSFIGMNEPMYLSNSNQTITVDDTGAGTYNGIDGSLIPAFTASHYRDIILPRALQPNEKPVIELHSKVSGIWVDASIATVDSLFCRINNNYYSGGSGESEGFFLSIISPNKIQVRQSQRCIGSSSWAATATWTERTWATVIAASDGFDRWRVRIGQAGLAEVADNGKIRAWVTFDGTTTPPTIKASSGIASVVRTSGGNAAGDYTVTLSNQAPHAFYNISAISKGGDTTDDTHENVGLSGNSNVTANSFRLTHSYGGGMYNSAYITCSVVY